MYHFCRTNCFIFFWRDKYLLRQTLVLSRQTRVCVFVATNIILVAAPNDSRSGDHSVPLCETD